MRKHYHLFITVLAALSMYTAMAQDIDLPEGVTVRKIWSNDRYNAFTSLIYFRGRFYCSFREGDSHVYGKDGVARIIASRDALTWESVAVLERKGYDLRDPKLSVTPDSTIMVIMGGSIYNGKQLVSQLTHVSFSDRDGKRFSDPSPVEIPEDVRTGHDWLWRVTWFRDAGYGVVYQSGKEWSVSLLMTLDGINYSLVTTLDVKGNPNESTVRVMDDGEMLMMIRREDEDKEGFWGRSRPPYTEWKWSKTGFRLGGPDFIALDDSLLVAGTRFYHKYGSTTAIYAGGRTGNFLKILTLPSGGDNSYPGIALHGKKLYVSYYSSHEGTAAIYLAEIPVEVIRKALQE